MRARDVAAAIAVTLVACGGRSERPPEAAPPPSFAPPAPPPTAAMALVPGGLVRVAFLDVGQGDAALVTTDDGASLLVDLGPKESEAKTRAALGALGHVDTLLVSHAHADHVGDLESLARTFPIGAFWESGFAEHPVKSYTFGLNALAERHVPRVLARAGMRFRLGAHADVEVLGPREPLLQRTRSDPNANSVVVRLTHAGPTAGTTTHVLFTGDAESPTEVRLLEHPETLAADVLKVAHHGSKHATSAAFLAAVHPKWSVISCAYGNDYGHPHLPTLKRLARAGVAIHRTDLEGDVTVESHDGQVEVHPARLVDEAARAIPGTNKRGALEAP